MRLDDAFNTYVSNITGLNDEFAEGASEEEIKVLLELTGDKNIEELAELLRIANGEKGNDMGMGTMAGLYFLESDRIMEESEYFKNCGTEYTVIGTNAIAEEYHDNRKWIPFAFDGSRCFFAVDLSPSKSGKAGQIITIDMDYDQCYLLADSLSDMFEKFTKWYNEGILVVIEEDDEKYISGKDGHIFNYFDNLLMNIPGKGILIELTDDYWKTFYENKLVVKNEKYYIDKSVLSGEKNIFIKNQTLSLDILQHMVNLKDVILHECKLKDITGIAKAPEVKKIILADCEISDGDLSGLAAAPKLKMLGLNVMSGKGLEKLSTIKTLKELSIRNVTDVDEDTVARFVKLQNLTLETMNFTNVDFISGMKGLKILDLDKLELDNIDFLASLPKLTNFNLLVKAKDEKGLEAIKNLPKLISFEYPVTDLSVYKGCNSLTSVGFSPEVETAGGFEVFENSNVSSFKVCGSSDEKVLNNIAEEMNKYTKIYSYGGTSWE